MPFNDPGVSPSGTVWMDDIVVGTNNGLRISLNAQLNVKPDRRYVEFQVTTTSGVLSVSASWSDVAPERTVSQSVGDGSWIIPLGSDADVYLIAKAAGTHVTVTQF